MAPMWLLWVLAGLGAWLGASLLAGVVIGRSIRLAYQPRELTNCAVEPRSYSRGAVVVASSP
jgi:hypothetical protein